MPQSDWLTGFWHTAQEQDFSQIWDLCRNIANLINFHYRIIHEKLMTKFFREFKTPFFCSKNVFPENPSLSCAISYGFIQIQFQQNTWTDRDGRSDRRMKRLFYRTLTAMLGGPQPLQSQYIGYWYHAPYLEKFIKIISLRINTSNNSKWKLKKRLYFLLDNDDSPAPTRYCKS